MGVMMKVYRMCCILLSFALVFSYSIVSYRNMAHADANQEYKVGTQTEFNALHKKTFQPGDKILLERGKVFTGGVTLKGSGTDKNWIELGAFGDGPKPIINANGADAAIKIENEQYWKIGNVEITNAGTAPDKTYSGIMIINSSKSTKTGFQITNIDGHDISGGKYMKKPDGMTAAGIMFKSTVVGSTYTNFDQVLIDQVHFRDQWAHGVVIKIPDYNEENGEVSAKHHTNVTLSNSTFRNLGGVGWLYFGVDQGKVDHVATYDIGWDSFDYKVIVAGFPRDSRDITVQNSESARVIPSNDSQAWDADMNMGGTNIWQYNYSHDNPGGFFLSLKKNEPDFKLVIRYNISQNDGAASIDDSRTTRFSAEVYNNTFFTERTPRIGHNKCDYSYYNNLWYSTSGGTRLFPHKPTFEHNAYYGFKAEGTYDSQPVTDYPKLTSPGKSGDGIGNTVGYKLQPGSPLINKGMAIPESGNRDYFGNSIKGLPDIGAHEYSNDAPSKGADPVRSSPDRYEAEDGNLSGGAVINHNGKASGNGVVGSMHPKGASIEFTGIYVASDGPHTMEVHYATSKTGVSLDVYANGTFEGSLSLPSTGGWGAAAGTVTIPVNLQANVENKIKIVQGKTNGAGADIDYIVIP